MGTIIGSGLFASAQTIIAGSGSLIMVLLAWLFGGALSLMGALCYAELASRFPGNGGDYLFLRQAFGFRVAFFYAWTKFWIIRPGSIAAMAFFCATSVVAALHWDSTHVGTVALAIVALLTLINGLGMQEGEWAQNLLTVIKVVLIAGLCLLSLIYWLYPSTDQVLATTTASPNWRLVFILVLFAYGGWNELAFVTGDLARPRDHMLPALLLGTVGVILIYCLFCLAIILALGVEAIAAAPDLITLLSATVVAPAFGSWATPLLHVTVAISALGAINGLIFTGGRIYVAVGQDFPRVAWLSQTPPWPWWPRGSSAWS